MKLDVVVPTYNRSDLLQLTLQSLIDAPVPVGLEVTVLVVDNNSKDNTAEVVREFAAKAPLPIVYVKETKQGLSHARNGGIAAGTADLIGFIDDDEEIEREWYNVIAREFADAETQFIGGPYLANCSTEMPSWLPPGYNGVIGVIPPKTRSVMAPPFPGNLQGGNAVFRRTVFDKVGMYDPRLGRSGKGLLSEEDAELYGRLIAAKIRGFHVPDLAIFHYIPSSRLTRSYYRRWCFWRGVSQGIADKKKREPAAYLFGLPRHRIRKAASGLMAAPRNLSATHGEGAPFARELSAWDLAGFIYGKFFINIDKFYADKK